MAVLLGCLRRAMPVIGYLPQEILGTSCYEYFHQADLRHLSEKHRQGDGEEQPQSALRVIHLYLYAQENPTPMRGSHTVMTPLLDLFPLAVLRRQEKIETSCYRFKTKYGPYVSLKSQWFSFRNPWTKEVEFIVCLNKVVK